MLCGLRPNGCMNNSEVIRMLIEREHNKRVLGTSKSSQRVYSEMRLGRPRTDQTER